jgi:hypothetical protein
MDLIVHTLWRQLLMLENDFSLELFGGWQLHFGLVKRSNYKHVTKDVLEQGGHGSLLQKRAVIFNAEDQWILGSFKCMLLDGVNNVPEANLGRQGVPMVNQWASG